MGFDAVSWRWSESKDEGPITIDHIVRHGFSRYVVRQLGACLGSDGVWYHERIVMSDERAALLLYDSRKSAEESIAKHCDPLGRLKSGVVTMV